MTTWPLARPPTAGIAGHLGHGVQVEVEEQHLEAHPGRGQSAFAAGVAGADDDQIIFFGIKGHGVVHRANEQLRDRRPEVGYTEMRLSSPIRSRG